jgi:paraquat-inducible protein A
MPLAHHARGADRLIGAGILLAAATLAAGWVLPVMTVRRLFFLSTEVSILRGLGELWANGHYGLFALVGLFSVIFPAGKLAAALVLWRFARPGELRHAGCLRWLERLGRWSMLDVFVVALIVVAIEVSLVSEVEMHAGIYVFAAGVCLSMLVVRRLLALASRVARG